MSWWTTALTLYTTHLRINGDLCTGNVLMDHGPNIVYTTHRRLPTNGSQEKKKKTQEKLIEICNIIAYAVMIITGI